MLRLPPRSTRTDTLFPYTTLFRSAGEICVGFLRADGFDAPFDADLAAQRLPVEAKRSLGIGGQFSAFTALIIGVEDEAAIIMPLEQHHRSEERSVGKVCVSKCRSRWSCYT